MKFGVKWSPTCRAPDEEDSWKPMATSFSSSTLQSGSKKGSSQACSVILLERMKTARKPSSFTARSTSETASSMSKGEIIAAPRRRSGAGSQKS